MRVTNCSLRTRSDPIAHCKEPSACSLQANLPDPVSQVFRQSERPREKAIWGLFSLRPFSLQDYDHMMCMWTLGSSARGPSTARSILGALECWDVLQHGFRWPGVLVLHHRKMSSFSSGTSGIFWRHSCRVACCWRPQ